MPVAADVEQPADFYRRFGLNVSGGHSCPPLSDFGRVSSTRLMTAATGVSRMLTMRLGSRAVVFTGDHLSL
jgi:hypothetical protein